MCFYSGQFQKVKLQTSLTVMKFTPVSQATYSLVALCHSYPATLPDSLQQLAVLKPGVLQRKIRFSAWAHFAVMQLAPVKQCRGVPGKFLHRASTL